MNLKEINIEQFQSINELYQFIENNSFELRRKWDLTDLWLKYKNHSQKEEEKKKCQWEIDCWLFEIKGSLLFSQIYSNEKNSSEITKYPNLNSFQKEVIDYIKERIKYSNNSILLARYNHLLWKCPNGIKREEYALNAIENYIISIKEYYKLYDINGNDENTYQIGELFEILAALSSEIKSDKTDLKALSKFLLFNANKLEFYTLDGILNSMLEANKIFKPKDFENTLYIFDNEIINNTKENIDDFFLVNSTLPTAIKIAVKIKSDPKKWQNEIGLAYLRMANKITREDKFWIKQDYHSSAIEAFKLAKKEKNRKLAEKLYANLKPQIKLPTHTIPYTQELQKLLKIHKTDIKSRANNILKRDSTYIYRFLSKGTFFPNYSEVIKASKKNNNAFLNYATTISFDKNKNIKNQKVSNTELKKIFDTYKFHIDMSVLLYLHYVLVIGIKSGKLTFKNLISYLIEHTWVGKTYIKYDLGGNEQHINWIQQLSPSIVEFYIQILAWQNSNYYKPSFILCIDSFTLKMEGIFRNFCERIGVPTSHSKEKGIQEAYIHNVFDNETIIEFFNEDDRLFFNYLFSNEGGLNLRNNVAHCFYNANEYHPDKMLLLIAALLRVAKYDLKKENPAANNV